MTMEECEAKRQLMRGCKEVYVLLDHTKINKYAPFVVCEARNIDVLITDSKVRQDPQKQEVLLKCAGDGVNLVYTSSEESPQPG